MSVQILIIFCIAVIFNALANILIKTSSLNDAVTPPESQGLTGLIVYFLNPVFIGGLACFGLALVGYRFVLGKGLKLSLAYPVFTSSGFIIVLIASAIFFKERLTWSQWTGIAFIMIGVWLTALHMFDVKG
ncbi:DMT family transporter [Leptospira sp. GIMC2001]|uniref:DMT family transporter n=1 Tax=Leptospira sp. GIMC2001 TaxID=1513297 RepID=UPI0004A5C3FA|nr:SMR family transporter [Leptospira sp. GIMC2001]AID56190.1 ethidium bromide-methyl viologen resistance protein EmrE [Leptospira sp. GIMC2001]WCL49151.1 SMR family transporter [Leptospira sp. GIMC2001]